MSSENNTKSATTCDICGKIFQSPQSMRVHRNVHSRKTTYTCRFCNQKFAYSHTYRVHVRSKHKKERRRSNSSDTNDGTLNKVRVPRSIKCLQCERKFETHIGLLVHTARAHAKDDLKPLVTTDAEGKPVYECRICNAKFATLISHQTHKRRHTKAKLFKCQICKEAFSEERDQLNHLKKHDLYKCLFCEITFSSEQKMREHMEESHKREILSYLTCTLCNICFDNEDQHGLHMIKMHSIEGQNDKQSTKEIYESAKEIKLNENTQEDNQSTGETHENDTNEEARYTCDTCGDSFYCRFYLKQHINVRHFDGKLLQDNEREIRRTTFDHGDTALTETNTPLNKRILQDFKVDTYKITYFIYSDSKKKYVCKVCLSTHQSISRLVKHIKMNASDHDIYLRRKNYSTYIDPCKSLNQSSNKFHSSQLHKSNDDQHFQDTTESENLCKVVDVRSIGTSVNHTNAPSDNENADFINGTISKSAEKHSHINNNIDDSTSISASVEEDPNDMEPLYTARPLLPGNDLSSGFDHYERTMYDLDNTVVSDIHNTEESYTNVQISKNYCETITTPSTYMDIDTQEKEVENSFAGTTMDARTDDPRIATKSIPFHNRTSETYHQCEGSSDISSAAHQLPLPSAASHCSQCKTPRYLSDQNQSFISCCLCHFEFCSNCSGLRANIYNALIRCKEYSSGLIWSCDRCRNILPKLSDLMSNLSSFDQHVNSRITKIGDHVAVLKENLNRTHHK